MTLETAYIATLIKNPINHFLFVSIIYNILSSCPNDRCWWYTEDTPPCRGEERKTPTANDNGGGHHPHVICPRPGHWESFRHEDDNGGFDKCIKMIAGEI